MIKVKYFEVGWPKLSGDTTGSKVKGADFAKILEDFSNFSF